MNGLPAGRAISEVYIGFFSAYLSRVNGFGCWLLIISIVRNINTAQLLCLVMEMVLDYGTLFCFSISTRLFIAD